MNRNLQVNMEEIRAMNSLSDLEHYSPIDISRVISRLRKFDSIMPSRVFMRAGNSTKERILQSRKEIDLILSSVAQLLYKKDFIKTPEDKIIYSWIIENFEGLLEYLDANQDTMITSLNAASKSEMVSGRVASFAKHLQSIKESFQEALMKTVIEYYSADVREEKAFMYILFCQLSITLHLHGGTRRTNPTQNRRQQGSLPLSWQGMMTNDSLKSSIRQTYEDETKAGKRKDSLNLDFFDETEEDMSADFAQTLQLPPNIMEGIQ